MPKTAARINRRIARSRPRPRPSPRQTIPLRPEEPREPKGASALFLAAHGRAAAQGGPARRKGNAMYSIFYIIGVIVVILAVLQLIA
jgi:hypothetical protein